MNRTIHARKMGQFFAEAEPVRAAPKLAGDGCTRFGSCDDCTFPDCVAEAGEIIRRDAQIIGRRRRKPKEAGKCPTNA